MRVLGVWDLGCKVCQTLPNGCMGRIRRLQASFQGFNSFKDSQLSGIGLLAVGLQFMLLRLGPREIVIQKAEGFWLGKFRT